MKQHGYKQVLMVSYVMFLGCCLVPDGQAGKLEATQDDQFVQTNTGLVPNSKSRKEVMLMFLGSLLRLKNHSDIKDEHPADTVLEDDLYQAYSDVISSRQDENNNSWMPPVDKKQRPCFWSVITCY